MRRCKDATYIVEKCTVGYAETSVTRVYRQYHGGRDLIAEFPRRETSAARKLAAWLEEEK